MADYILLLRPQHYLKNITLFFPLFFAMQISQTGLIIDTALAFFSFSCCASAIYILNDYRDIEADRLHPRKKMRPLASGAIPPTRAFILMGFLLFFGFGLMLFLSPQASCVLAGYILMNIAYCFGLKKISILDVTFIAIGFVLRLFIGSIVGNIPLSMWIIVITFLLSLFLALAKRRDDVLVFLKTGKKMRDSIDGYTLQFVDAAMMIMASIVIVSYLLYTTSTEVIHKLHSDHLYLTAVFVVLGVMRYLQIALVEENSGSPTDVLLHDRFMQITILGWFTSFSWILYA
jgi:4-hydroxybenzoate polyprenyltransferase